MRRLATLWLCACATLAGATEPPSVPATAETLRQAAAEARSGHLKTVPGPWVIQDGDRRLPLSNDQLLDIPAEDPKRGEKMAAWLELAAAELDTPPAPSPRAGQRLASILARAEFSDLRAESDFAAWRRHASEWLEARLASLFGPIARHVGGVVLIFWFLALAALATFSVLLYRTLANQGSALLLSGAASPSTTRLRDPQSWLADAAQAAARRDFALAICCSYWAAISSLQHRGLLPHGLARTPREILSWARSSPGAPPLDALTSAMERHWYAAQPASEADYLLARDSAASIGEPRP